MKSRVAVVTPLQDLPEIMARLEQEFDLVRIPITTQPVDTSLAKDPIQAVFTSSHEGVPEWLWDVPSLKIIGNYGVGYDGIDTERAARQGIWVTNTPGVLNDEVADLALGLMIAVVRQLPTADRYAREGRWATQGNFPLTDHLHGKRLGMLGMGAIGLEIAKRAEAFKLEIAYFCRNPKQVKWRYEADLIELAQWSDLLCCIVPGGKATYHLVDEAVLEALGPNGYLVNVGRGSVVAEQELVTALATGRIAGAALDVYEQEPQIHPGLLEHPKVVLQPHTGSGTAYTRKQMGFLVIDNILAVLAGEPPLTPVNQLN